MTLVARGLGRGARGSLVALGLGRILVVPPVFVDGWPRVINVTANRLKISDHYVAVVSFDFDQPVDEWVVRVDGTNPFDGTPVDRRVASGMLNGSVVVNRSMARHGLNRVRVYARIGSHWSI